MRILGVLLIGSAVGLCFAPVKKCLDFPVRILCMLGLWWGMLAFNYSPNDVGWQMTRASVGIFTAMGILCALVSLASEYGTTPSRCRQ